MNSIPCFCYKLWNLGDTVTDIIISSDQHFLRLFCHIKIYYIQFPGSSTIFIIITIRCRKLRFLLHYLSKNLYWVPANFGGTQYNAIFTSI